MTTATHKPATDCADLLLRYLEILGVEYIFGIPGGAIEPLFNALGRCERRGGTIRPVVTRHETGAAFMADGYTRESGKLGVCCATTGPGTTNLITGVSSAYVDHIPMLVITAQTKLANFGRGAFQESSFDAIDTVKMLESCTHYSSIVSHPEQFERKLMTALMTALRDAKGPVHLSVPIDIFHSHTPEALSFPNFNSLLQGSSSFVDKVALGQLCEHMLKARKVVVLVGRRACHASAEILQFAELTNTPIVTTPQGKSCISAYHPHNLGVFGFAGHHSATDALQDPEVDLILACGSDFREWSTNGWDVNGVMNDKLVVIDNSTESFQRAPMAKLHICGDIQEVFKMLLERAEQAKRAGQACPASMMTSKDAFTSQESNTPERRGEKDRQCAPRHIEIDEVTKFRRAENLECPIKPQRLMCELKLRFPQETCFLADTGNSFAWSTHYLFHSDKGAYRVAMGYASMGWAIGAAVGMALANRDQPVVSITGDGSFLMYGMELTVAVEERLPIFYVVLYDRVLGMVMHGQRLTGGERIAHTLPAVDFVTLAQSVGANGFRVNCMEDFNQFDYQALRDSGLPTVIEVDIDREQVPPMATRVRMLREVMDE
jgi:acetolactate synthase-1/2/3 large subunit